MIAIDEPVGDTTIGATLVFTDPNGKVIRAIAANDFQSNPVDDAFGRMYWDNRTFWITAANEDHVDDLYAVQVDGSMKSYDVSVLGFDNQEFAVRPDTGKLFFDTYHMPQIVDSTGIPPKQHVMAYVYDLSTGAKTKLFDLSTNRSLAPVWLNDTTVEYNGSTTTERTMVDITKNVLVPSPSNTDILNNNSAIHQTITFAEPVFDASMPVGNTGVTVFYPKDGFYGMGIVKLDSTITNANELGLVEIGTAKPIEPQAPSKTLGLHVSVAKNLDQAETLQSIVAKIKPDTMHIDGRIVIVNDNDFYITKIVGQDAGDAWAGFTLKNDKVISVGITYPYAGPGASDEDIAAYKNNDRLFLQILQNMKF